MKTIKFNVFLFGIIGILIGCNSKDINQEILKKDSVSEIVKKSDSSKKYQLKNCNCEENPELKDYISCEEAVFSNGAKIYRQFNCDSSWLVFENKKIKKNIYSLEKEMIEYTHKLGYVEWYEYEISILFAERLASGTSAPYNFVVINKENGEIIKELGRELYRSDTKDFPIFVSIDANNPTSINFYNFRSNKSYKFPFINKKFQKTLLFDVYELHPEELFENGSIVNGIFKIKYSYKLKENDDFKYEELIIDLNKVVFK